MKAKDKNREASEDSDSSSSSLPSLEEDEEAAGGKRRMEEEVGKKSRSKKKNSETSERKAKGGKVNKLYSHQLYSHLCLFPIIRLCLYIDGEMEIACYGYATIYTVGQKSV